MNIKTKLEIGALSSILTLIAAGFFFFLMNKQVDSSLHHDQATERVIQGIYELDLIAQDYLLHQEEMTKEQWEKRYDSLDRLIKDLDVQSPKERKIIRRIQMDFKNVRPLFSELTARLEGLRNGATDVHVFTEWEQRLVGQISANLESMVSHASQLNIMSNQKLEGAQHAAMLSGTAFVGVLCLLTALISLLASRNILKPIDNLRKGAKALAEGALDHRVDGDGARDEFRDLTAAFNEMAAKLKDTYAALEQEVTQHKKAEERIAASLAEKELLIKEVFHRSQNSMQIIRAMLTLQSGFFKDDTARQVLMNTEMRIQSMALAHQKLYQSKDLVNINLKDYINDLAQDLFRSHKKDPGRIKLILNIDNKSLKIDSAIPCGLVIHELVSNCLQHAFPDDREGEVRVDLKTLGDEEIEVRVRDNGIGLPENFDFNEVRTLGLQMVLHISESQLKGKILFSTDQGTDVQLRFREPEYKERI